MPTLHILDVRHGNSAVLVDTKGLTIIDAGLKADLLEFLVDRKLTNIQNLLLSHADSDHIGGAIGLLASDKFKIKNVFLNTDSLKGSAIWEDLLFTLQDKFNKGKVFFQVGLTSQLNGKIVSGDVLIEVLAPSQYLAAKGPGGKDGKGRKLSSNSISAVIRLCHDDKHIAILPGDIDMVGLENLVENSPEIHSWLAIFPHHGGLPGSYDPTLFTSKFYQTVKPDVIVFSIEDNNKDYPNVAVVKTIAKLSNNVRMLSTRSSPVLLSHIDENKGGHHYNSVGTITVIFGKYPPKIDCANNISILL